MHRGKTGQFFRIRNFPSNPSWIMCRWTLQDSWGPPKHPRDASHTFSARCLRPPIRPVAAETARVERKRHSLWVRAREVPQRQDPTSRGQPRPEDRSWADLCIESESRPNPGLLVLGRASWLCSQSPKRSGFLITNKEARALAYATRHKQTQAHTHGATTQRVCFKSVNQWL